MINFEKLNIFKVKKEMKNDLKIERENNEERPYTFKITKRRSPWSTEEDEAITVLVNKFGTGNWTHIATEMSNIYGFKTRSGKQCRERWHNHLDPSINKDYWTEKEENILFMKHIEYGNKWSDIAKFLPGRTDNAIKNHFYSKLRKFIRKILKQINKDNLLKSNGIDPNKYNSDRIYKMIKKNKMAYNSLNKETILTMILNYERNSKLIKGDFLTRKVGRRKSNRTQSTKENLYSEKINKRYVASKKIMIGINDNYISHDEITTHPRTRLKTNNNLQFSLYTSTRNRKASRDFIPTEPISKINISLLKIFKDRSRRNLKRRNIRDDFIYDDEISEDIMKIENDDNYQSNGGKEIAEKNLNIIINKSVLFKNYMKEEERLSATKSADKSNKDEFTFEGYSNDNRKSGKLISYINKENFLMNNSSSMTTNPSIQPIPILNPLLNSNNFVLEDRIYRYENFPFVDHSIPLISPINPSKLYPPSTRNYFNIDFLHEFNYGSGFNLYRPNCYNTTTPTSVDNLGQHIFQTNKEVDLHNKILINEKMELERNLTPTFNEKDSDPTIKKEEIKDQENTMTEKKRPIRPSIDLKLVNEGETGNFFYSSVQGIIQQPHNDKENSSQENALVVPEDEGSVTNISEKSGREVITSTENKTILNTCVLKKFNKPSMADLTISPKSAFVKMK